MDQNIDLLKKIKKVEVADNLYDKIMLRIEQKSNTLAFYKVSIAASLIIGLLLGEVVLVIQGNKDNPTSSQITTLVTINNNSLYYE